jgi:pyridoxamine 5'-phosphate oxidase
VSLIPDSFGDPFELFSHYFGRAQKSEPHEGTAVALATADTDGRPAVRMVLLKGVEAGRFYFFTNYGSRKARHLDENPHAALCFYWSTLGVQVRVEGRVEKATAAESDAYFATRPRGSQLAAWSSEQSAPLGSRATLLSRYEEIKQRFANGDVPRPPFWGGFHLTPERIEFWHSEAFRMHDRLVYLRDPLRNLEAEAPESESGAWRRQRLFP